MVPEFARLEPHITGPDGIIATFLEPLFGVNRRFTIFTPQSLLGLYKLSDKQIMIFPFFIL